MTDDLGLPIEAPVLKIKKLRENAIIPRYQTEGAACFDLHALIGGRIPPHQTMTIRTGLAVEIPPGWVMKIYPRSGNAFKHGITLINSTGIVDSDYRGELQIGLRNDGDGMFLFYEGDRIAQAMLERAEQVVFEEVEVLSATERGAGGFGSTGSR